MNPWLETVVVGLLACCGIIAGRAFSRLQKPYWILGYLISAILLATLIMSRCVNWLSFVPPISWLVVGRAKFVVLCLAVTMGLTTPISRLRRGAEKVVVWCLIVIVVGWFSIFPFLAPALVKNHLASLETTLDSDGICYQSTSYTCGPAAAVTALRKLGISANEGEIAVLSRTSPFTGTLPHCLYTAIQDRFSNEGLRCRYRYFDSIDQLRDAGVTLAVVKDAFLLNHCVVVLDVSDQMVTLADPVTGKVLMSHEQFRKIWRFSGIVLRRDGTETT